MYEPVYTQTCHVVRHASLCQIGGICPEGYRRQVEYGSVCHQAVCHLERLFVDDVGILLVFVRRYPHLCVSGGQVTEARLTFLNVLKPARILPPIQVEYCA